MATFTATLCNADGSEAGCGRCVRPAGHPLGGAEMHQGPGGKRDRFYLMERCPFCVELREEGPELAAHVREVHGGGVVVAGAAVAAPVEQLGLFGGGA